MGAHSTAQVCELPGPPAEPRRAGEAGSQRPRSGLAAPTLPHGVGQAHAAAGRGQWHLGGSRLSCHIHQPLYWRLRAREGSVLTWAGGALSVCLRFIVSLLAANIKSVSLG